MTDNDESVQADRPDPAADQEEFQRAYEQALAVLAEYRATLPEGVEERDPYPDELYWAQVAWLRLKWGAGDDAPACPYCGTNVWSLSELFEFDTSAGRLEPVFGVTCSNCGQSTFVRAQIAGLADVPDPQEGAEGDATKSG